ncbi:hypothetical protein D6C81_09144, partial [Aureobasidium pullulans]
NRTFIGSSHEKRHIRISSLCDGGKPCSACALRDQECVTKSKKSRRPLPDSLPQRSIDSENTSPTATDDLQHTPALTEEISQLEERLARLKRLSASRDQTLSQSQTPLLEDRHVHPGAERSIDSGEGLAATYPEHKNANVPAMNQSTLSKVMETSEICSSIDEWPTLLETFCEAVHPLYPFIEISALRVSLTGLQQHVHTQVPRVEATLSENMLESYAQVLVCLALGRCTMYGRSSVDSGRYSAGWRFYCAAIDLLGNTFDPCVRSRCGLSRVQTFTLMGLYLVRIDAIDRAFSVISLAVTDAYRLKLHCESALRLLPRALSENCRRTWWSLYILEHRMASYANRPSLIQENKVNTDLPDHLSNIWSNHPSHRHNAVTASGEGTEGRDTADDQVTILYLNAMIEHSKFYSKVWRELHFEDLSDQPINQATLESLESMLSMWKHNLPNGLKFNASFAEEELHRPMRARRSRLRILLHMRDLWLRITIRKPLRQRKYWLDNFDNEATCIKLAGQLVDASPLMSPTDNIFTFPFVHYLLGAASIVIGLASKLPVFKNECGAIAVQAARLVNTFCERTWVSGQMARSIAKLNEMVVQAVGTDVTGLPELGSRDHAASDSLDQPSSSNQPTCHARSSTQRLANPAPTRESNILDKAPMNSSETALDDINAPMDDAQLMQWMETVQPLITTNHPFESCVFNMPGGSESVINGMEDTEFLSGGWFDVSRLG